MAKKILKSKRFQKGGSGRASGRASMYTVNRNNGRNTVRNTKRNNSNAKHYLYGVYNLFVAFLKNIDSTNIGHAYFKIPDNTHEYLPYLVEFLNNHGLHQKPAKQDMLKDGEFSFGIKKPTKNNRKTEYVDTMDGVTHIVYRSNPSTKLFNQLIDQLMAVVGILKQNIDTDKASNTVKQLPELVKNLENYQL